MTNETIASATSLLKWWHPNQTTDTEKELIEQMLCFLTASTDIPDIFLVGFGVDWTTGSVRKSKPTGFDICVEDEIFELNHVCSS